MAADDSARHNIGHDSKRTDSESTSSGYLSSVLDRLERAARGLRPATHRPTRSDPDAVLLLAVDGQAFVIEAAGDEEWLASDTTVEVVR